MMKNDCTAEISMFQMRTGELSRAAVALIGCLMKAMDGEEEFRRTLVCLM